MPPSLPSPALPALRQLDAPTHDADFLRESAECQREVRGCLRMIGEVVQRRAAGERAGDAMRAVAAKHGMALKTFEKRFYALKSAGWTDWRVLIDRRRFPLPRVGKGGAGLNRVFIEQEWQPICLLFQRDQYRKQAHNHLIQKWRQWCAGDADSKMLGYAEPPKGVGRANIPAGWSIGNLRRHAPAPAAKARVSQGAKATLNIYSPKNRTSREDIEPGRIMEWDDQNHDIRVNFAMNKSSARLLGYNVVDVGSHCCPAAGYKPKVLRKDGTHMELSEEDFLWFVIHVLMTVGYRADIGTLWKVESGTATIRETGTGAYFREGLEAMTKGAIEIKVGNTSNKGGYSGAERGRAGGNPRFKPTVEGWFSLLREVCAFLPGQVGKDPTHSPEELIGMEMKNRELLAIRRELPEAVAAQLRLPFLECGQAIRAIEALRHAINGRTEHQLEGWSRHMTTEFRLAPDSQIWQPIAALEALPEVARSAVTTLLQSQPDIYTNPVRKSPVQVWNEAARKFRRLPAYALVGLLPPEYARERRLNSEATLILEDPELDPTHAVAYLGVVRNERGQKIMLKRGETYLWYINPYNPEVAQVCEAIGSRRGAYIGEATRLVANSPLDVDAWARNQGRIKALTAAEEAEVSAQMEHLRASREADARHNQSLPGYQQARKSAAAKRRQKLTDSQDAKTESRLDAFRADKIFSGEESAAGANKTTTNNNRIESADADECEEEVVFDPYASAEG